MSQNKIIGTDLLLEFLEVALHSIVYYRKLYPQEIFIKKKIYGILVNISQHPELNEYIKNIISCAKQLIQENVNSLKSINIVYLNKDKMPIEKFTFSLNKLQIKLSETDSYFIKTEEGLRTLCLKLSMLETYLEPLPKNSSFIINIVTNHAAHVTLEENFKCHDFFWIVDNVKEIHNGLLLPIKSLKTDYLDLHCYALEDKSSKFLRK